MNTKFSFALLVIVIALVATACAPDIIDSSEPIALAVPVTGNSTVETVRTDSQDSRLWSGEISLSDNNSPDYIMDGQTNPGKKSESACMSEDSLPRRQGGCVE
jgi:hypothetical protein